jgi:hypothetical protein
METRIPPFRSDGYLPEGLYLATEAEVIFRFGSGSRRRQLLALRLRRWIELGRAVGALRVLVDGSFVTAKVTPNDIDAVILMPSDFAAQVERGTQAAVELQQMLASRRPEEVFAAENSASWEEWISFFSLTREFDRRRKGLVEIAL